MALSKSSPVSSSHYTQPLMIQTTNSQPNQTKPVMTVCSVPATPSQPTIIVPAGPAPGQTAIRMPIQVSGVPTLQVGVGIRPINAGANGSAASGYSNMQGIPIITPSGTVMENRFWGVYPYLNSVEG